MHHTHARLQCGGEGNDLHLLNFSLERLHLPQAVVSELLAYHDGVLRVNADKGSEVLRVLLDVAGAHEAAKEDDRVREGERVEVVAQHLLRHVPLLNQLHLVDYVVVKVLDRG